jgi:hypothetical protein
MFVDNIIKDKMSERPIGRGRARGRAMAVDVTGAYFKELIA